MSSVNKVILVGNLGKDPEIRTMQSGDKVANFSIATSESWKDKASGERKEKTQWHNIVIWNPGLVTVVERYCKKGSKIYIEGQLETRSYQDGAGVDKYVTEVVLRPYKGELTLLDSAGGDNRPAQAAAAPAAQQRPAAAKPKPISVDPLEDTIPF